MIVAGIDIGTNTLLLLVAEIDENGRVRQLEHQQRLPRLGKDVDRMGAIQVSAFDRIAWIVQEYRNIAQQFHAEEIVACATSAVRDASNRDEFTKFIEKGTGIRVEILTGDEEAVLTYKGALSGINRPGPFVVLDIGGGSTELIFQQPGGGNGNAVLHRYSLQIGAVRLTERFFKHDPPLPEEIESAKSLIIEEVSQVRNPGFQGVILVGVAGTVTTLACIDQGLAEFELEKVAGFTLTDAHVARLLSQLTGMNSREISALSAATSGRADILTAGTLILHEVMAHFRFPSVVVSERGLRFGLVLREWERRQGDH
jgi:exopolyphosphatase/guanosine-5'-triphosphate,3'-diphosphate pyrophosphatase